MDKSLKNPNLNQRDKQPALKGVLQAAVAMAPRNKEEARSLHNEGVVGCRCAGPVYRGMWRTPLYQLQRGKSGVLGEEAAEEPWAPSDWMCHVTLANKSDCPSLREGDEQSNGSTSLP